MPLLPRRDLAELLLRHALDEPVEAGKDLGDVLALEDLDLGPAQQRLDARQALPVEVAAQPVVDLAQDEGEKALAVIPAAATATATATAARRTSRPGSRPRRVQHLVHEPDARELVARDPPAHDEGLVGERDAQALHERAGGPALGYETQGREGQ